MNKTIYNVLLFIIALVWFINGLICKVLNLVPRHEEIVARILGREYARPITFLIGVSEVMMAIWILSKYKPKFNALTQIIIIGTMNLLEFMLAPDLLLWGKFNLVFAIMFIVFIYYHGFILSKKLS